MQIGRPLLLSFDNEYRSSILLSLAELQLHGRDEVQQTSRRKEEHEHELNGHDVGLERLPRDGHQVVLVQIDPAVWSSPSSCRDTHVGIRGGTLHDVTVTKLSSVARLHGIRKAAASCRDGPGGGIFSRWDAQRDAATQGICPSGVLCKTTAMSGGLAGGLL